MKPTRFGKGHQINTDSSELDTGHRDGSSVLSLWNTQVLLVDIHKLEVVLAKSVTLAALEQEVEDIWGVLGLESEDVIVLSGAKDLSEGGEVDSKSYVAIASVWREALCLEHHGNQGDVGVVHSLQRNSRVIAVEVTILDQILDGIDDLEESVFAL